MHLNIEAAGSAPLKPTVAAKDRLFENLSIWDHKLTSPAIDQNMTCLMHYVTVNMALYAMFLQRKETTSFPECVKS